MIGRIIIYTMFIIVGFLSGCKSGRESSPPVYFQKVEKNSFTAPAEEVFDYILECNGTGVDPLRLEIEEAE